MDVKTLCLGVLTLGEASGYEIKKQFEKGPFSYFHQAGFGSIYPALGLLARQGLVTCTELAQERRPDKKVYAITPEGMEAFKKALSKMPAGDRIRSETMVFFFFAHLIEPEHLEAVYDQYLEFYRANLKCLRDLDPEGIANARLFTRGFGRAFYQAAVSYMEENRGLLFGGEAGDDARTGTGG